MKHLLILTALIGVTVCVLKGESLRNAVRTVRESVENG